MPLNGTCIGHRLDDVILDRQWFTNVFRTMPDRKILGRELGRLLRVRCAEGRSREFKGHEYSLLYSCAEQMRGRNAGLISGSVQPTMRLLGFRHRSYSTGDGCLCPCRTK